ncbi:two-component system, NtrC family, sensor histidine kinase PilS [Lampropedia hyalina DSM 16112]|jgi:two-component system sensor histidine kinase PilS (NtrC family)|uniref:histidine kinase n=1 Tax=Lampropedia hyalina DSM 16112 TaxID=1122156 RepID=A0A1M5BE86_9BURK|nr:ATP-binding protein [Lampropedia hyalina]SHF40821.1 two-component system, NtrC family, sensor histidine kinase PilS [Lampropedia hyalina DSM 16112]
MGFSDLLHMLGLRRSLVASSEPFQRLWAGFLTGRLMLALAIGVLLLAEHVMDGTVSSRVLWLVGIYFSQAMLLRGLMRHVRPRRGLAWHWLLTVGFDIGVCALLQLWYAGGSISFLALFGIPVLMAAAMGSTSVMALTIATLFAVLMLVSGWPKGFSATSPQVYYQAFVTWLGFLVLALLVHQLATRLSSEEQEARKSRRHALLQSQISELIIRNLNDGVIVLGRDLSVNSLNPAAREILGLPAQHRLPFLLTQDASWQPLVALVQSTFIHHQPQSADLTLASGQQTPWGVHARSWLTAQPTRLRRNMEVQCVIFLHDLRAMQAQLRTEKLAAMGRMSAAVAHEIRNPLSAIVQANALLAEDLPDPGSQRLTTMIGQNAERLRRIAEDILDIVRVQRQATETGTASDSTLPLDETTAQVWQDWISQHRMAPAPHALHLNAPEVHVPFDHEHLRRILLNLLDNARRYMGPHPDSLQVATGIDSSGQTFLQVWSDGEPLEKSVERHLFEPFFSSESRSSGLGLFLCRELCERHHARIGYQRQNIPTQRGMVAGNAFTVYFHGLASSCASPQATSAPSDA